MHPILKISPLKKKKCLNLMIFRINPHDLNLDMIPVCNPTFVTRIILPG